jgi:uncharacterized membrane protein
MMRISRTSLLTGGLVVLSFLMTAALYTRLPELVPTRWNAHGDAVGLMAKPWGAFLMPLVMAGAYLLLTLVPRISPQGYRVERFQRAFEVIRAAILAFLFLLSVLVLLAGLGVPIPMDRAIFASVGLLFVVLGNVLGKVTKNFFVGIRTPWTLASDEVWLRTHRLGGRLFVLAGLSQMIAGLAGAGDVALFVSVAIAAGVPVVYSYVIYRRTDGFKNGPSQEDSPEQP